MERVPDSPGEAFAAEPVSCGMLSGGGETVVGGRLGSSAVDVVWCCGG